MQLSVKKQYLFQIDFHAYLENAIKKPLDMTEEVVVYAVDYIPKMAALVQAADKGWVLFLT